MSVDGRIRRLVGRGHPAGMMVGVDDLGLDVFEPYDPVIRIGRGRESDAGVDGPVDLGVVFYVAAGQRDGVDGLSETMAGVVPADRSVQDPVSGVTVDLHALPVGV